MAALAALFRAAFLVEKGVVAEPRTTRVEETLLMGGIVQVHANERPSAYSV